MSLAASINQLTFFSLSFGIHWNLVGDCFLSTCWAKSIQKRRMTSLNCWQHGICEANEQSFYKAIACIVFKEDKERGRKVCMSIFKHVKLSFLKSDSWIRFHEQSFLFKHFMYICYSNKCTLFFLFLTDKNMHPCL